MTGANTAIEDARTEAMNDVLANNWWAAALRGTCAVIFGMFAFATPGIAMLSMALVFAAYCLVDGVSLIAMAVRGARKGERWTWLALNGLLGIAAGLATAVWPGLTVIAFSYLIAAWALVSGTAMLISAFRVKPGHGRIWMVVGGVAGLALGVLIALAPFIGALVLTFWIGAHALVLGVALLVLAYRLYAKRTDHPHHLAAA
jgi:uncharacterized membrane protein HdeD (DUF308 family)